MNFPEYQTDRVMLRQLSEQDAQSVLCLFSNPSVIAYYDLDVISELSQAQRIIGAMDERFKSNTGIRWAITLKRNGELVGTCGFNSWDEKARSAVIGYDLLPNCWGQGIATEVVNELVKQAFLGNLPCGELNRIQADTVPGNVASERVLLKVGCKEEGLRRQSGYWKNQYHDLKCFGLLKSEYKPKT
ncbi:GNAT family N-acetyltransferase [Vibrio sp. LaRot3]|uniref:GNAT family N-acetyltransferase n=1 Tax=Vibrio sp. LaRot3 TaxID=2998829 RepID=UPI0022CDD4C3|nr:GNAT family protein [Vibrio sp. LaRot3]MDA0149857.1 GNAT family protein [Vibrio sp. LaRot3]